MSSEITLTNENCVKLLIKYTELAQQKGAFLLNEAGILKRAIDVLSSNSKDPEITEPVAKNLMVQAVHKGQRSGAYTLSDAALLDKVVNLVSTQVLQVPQVPQVPPQEPVQGSQDFDSLDDLSAPVPLKPREI